MKAIANLAAIVSAVVIFITLLIAQSAFHHSFGTASQIQTETTDSASIAPEVINAEAIALN